MTRSVLLIGGAHLHLLAAKSLGMRVAVVQVPGEFPAAYQRLSDRTLLTDYADPVDLARRVLPIVRAWHWAEPFSQAISFTDPGLLPAALVREELGLGGTPVAATALLRDKAAMRRNLAGSGLATVPFAEVSEVGQVLAFARRHGYPFILKPADGVGRANVRTVRSDAEARAALAGIRTAGHPAALAETLIAGPEFTVEAISAGGLHRVVCVTESLVTAGRRAAGHVTPARITEADAMAIARHVEDFLDVVGIVDGPSHTQVILTGDQGPVVVESHDRIGADPLHDLVRFSYRHDLPALAFAVPAGLAPLPEPLRWTRRPGTAVCYLRGAGARLTSIAGVEEARSSPGVVRFSMANEESLIGEHLTPDERPAFAVAVGVDADTALARAKAALDTLRLEYE
ncbi:ATP-grasp domain-containing protein [Spirillospora sp. NBC_00431]